MGEPDEAYTCAGCGKAYLRTRSDADAIEEAKTEWPDFNPDEMAIVCQDCWEELMTERYRGGGWIHYSISARRRADAQMW